MSPALPLSGVTVLDMTQVWAGPMVTRMLANMGATVIKVEAPRRPDFLRTLGSDLAQRYPDGDPGPDPENRNAWFNTQNHDKLGVVIDAKAPEGLALLEGLAPHCQVLVSNARTGVMDRLGLGYHRYVQLRGADAVVAEMSSFGATGDRAGRAGFGLQFEAASGAGWLIGDTGSPMLTGFALADAVGAVVTASAIATALYGASRTGRGAYIDASLVEAYLSTMGDVLLDWSVADGETPDWGGNRKPDCAPHGVYPLAGGERHLSIAVENDEQWDAFRAVAGDERFGDPELKDRDHRVARRAWLDEQVGAWVAGFTDGAALADRLQAAGVPAAPVADAGEVAGDVSLHASGFYSVLSHPSTGTHRYPGLPYTIDGDHLGLRTPAPRWGEHTEQVLRDWLGLTGRRIDDLAARGVIERR